MEKFYIIEGMKPTPESVTPEPVEEVDEEEHNLQVTFKISNSDLADIVDRLFTNKLDPVRDYKNVEEIYDELVHGSGEVEVENKAGAVFLISYEMLIETISEIVGIGGFHVADGYVIPDDKDELYDMMIESMMTMYDDLLYAMEVYGGYDGVE